MISKFKKFTAPLMMLMFVLFAFVGAASAEIHWNTSTVGLDIKTDVSVIGSTTGRTLNVAILGLDGLGNVDVYGESGGSKIIASVATLIGTIDSDGATSPTSAVGSFAAVTKYILLNQGIGVVHVVYPNDASGTDQIQVVLFEKRTDDGGNVVTKQIATKTITLAVSPAVASAAILNVQQFKKVSSDTNGSDSAAVEPADEDADAGITGGKMTANVAGGYFLVKAYKISGLRAYTLDTSASGTVTVTLTGLPSLGVETDGLNRASSATTYTCTGTMQSGVANVSVPTGFTKAGQYVVTATMGDLSSVTHKISDDNATRDSISIIPENTPAAIGLACNMSVVSNTTAANYTTAGVNDNVIFDPTITTVLLDQFGNYVRTAGVTSNVIVKVVDANTKISDFNVTITAGTNMTNSMQDGSTFSTGTASLTGSVPLNSLIKTSNTLSIKIVSGSNQLVFSYGPAAVGTGLNAAAQVVGTAFQFVDAEGLGVDQEKDGDCKNNASDARILTSSDKIKVTNLTSKTDGTKDSSTVSVTNGTPDLISCLFTYPTSAANLQTNGFLVQDDGKSYADVIVSPYVTGGVFALSAGSPSAAYILDKAGNMVTTLNAKVNANGTFTVAIDAGNIYMKDAWGNVNDQGDVSITTTKGTVSGSVTVSSSDAITISYPVGTTGTDVLTFNFTQPGISSVNGGSGLTINFPDVSTLASFDTYPALTDAATLSINAGMPLTIFPRTASGTLLTVPDGYFIDYDSAGLFVYYDVNSDATLAAAEMVAGSKLVSGSNVGASKGRYPLMVQASTIPGTYKVTIRSVDSKITKTVNIKVVAYSVPLALDSSAASVVVGSTKAVKISGGSAPYTVVSADETKATAAVAGYDLTITAVAVGGPVDVTVKDNNGTTAVVKVTVVAPSANALTVAPATLSIATGSLKTVSVSGGKAPYTVTTSDAATVTVDPATLAEAGTVKVNGVKETTGGATVTVTVTDSLGDKKTVAVTVVKVVPVDPPQDVYDPKKPETTVKPVDTKDPEALAAAPIHVNTANKKVVIDLNFPAYTKPVNLYALVIIPDGTPFYVNTKGEFEPGDKAIPLAENRTEALNMSPLLEIATVNTLPKWDYSGWWLVGSVVQDASDPSKFLVLYYAVEAKK